MRLALLFALLAGCTRATPDIAPIRHEMPAPVASVSTPPLDPLLPAGALAGKVQVVDGRVVVERDGAVAFQSLGPHDEKPIVSHSKSMLAFVRRRPEIQDSYVFADTSDRCDLMLVREGETPRVLVAGGGREDGPFLEGMWAPFFAHDDRHVVFESALAVTTHGVYATDLTGRVNLVTDGRVIGEVEKGKWKGHVFVEQSRLDWINPVDSPKYRGRIARYAILSVAGKELEYLGDDDAKAFGKVFPK
jgi:hypothetical protein